MLKTTGIGLSTLSLLHSVLFNDIAIHLKGIVIPVHCINPKATLTVAVLTESYIAMWFTVLLMMFTVMAASGEGEYNFFLM